MKPDPARKSVAPVTKSQPLGPAPSSTAVATSAPVSESTVIATKSLNGTGSGFVAAAIAAASAAASA